MAKSPGRDFYDKQIAYLEALDVAGLMSQYHEAAVLVNFEQTIRGKAALQTYMTAYLARLGSFKLKATDKFTETEDSIFFEATVVTAHGEAKVYDVFMLREGRVTQQFAGLISFTPFEK